MQCTNVKNERQNEIISVYSSILLLIKILYWKCFSCCSFVLFCFFEVIEFYLQKIQYTGPFPDLLEYISAEVSSHLDQTTKKHNLGSEKVLWHLSISISHQEKMLLLTDFSAPFWAESAHQGGWPYQHALRNMVLSTGRNSGDLHQRGWDSPKAVVV